jgi:hypothetical protein
MNVSGFHVLQDTGQVKTFTRSRPVMISCRMPIMLLVLIDEFLSCYCDF